MGLLDAYFKTKDESYYDNHGTPPRKNRQVTIKSARTDHAIRAELASDEEYLFKFTPMCIVEKFKECPHYTERQLRKESDCEHMNASSPGIAGFWSVECYCEEVKEHLVSHYFKEEFLLHKLEEL